MVQTSGGRSCLNMPVLRPLDTSSGWDGSLPFGRVLIRLCVCGFLTPELGSPRHICRYYEGAAQFWCCSDATGAKIRYAGAMKKRKSPPPYIEVAAGTTKVIEAGVSLQQSFGITCSSATF